MFRLLSASCAGNLKQHTWGWSEDSSTVGGAILEDGAEVLARVKGEVLTFEKAGLDEEVHDEIVLSAVAIVEARRRRKRVQARGGNVVGVDVM